MQALHLPDSMAKAVAMFNILHGQTMTEEQAWHLITLIDLSASQQGLSVNVPPPAAPAAVEPEIVPTAPAPVQEAPDTQADEPADDIISMSDIPEEAWSDPARYDMASHEEAEVSSCDGKEDVYESPVKWWTPTHRWKIHVEPRDRDNPSHEATYVHCRHKPDQALFNHHYAHFLNGTHRVYVLESNGQTSTDITRDYLFSGKPIAAETVSVKSQAWEEGDADYRIRFWDTRVGGLNYVYFKNRPSGMVLAKYHCVKQFAVVEKRPVH
ncbi:hypothetical protein MWH03_00420 [Klebsiella pneumoniae]|nr:hypothetical protein [Klebsiella pneumoniae]